MAVWYGESRKFVLLPNGKYITVWKTYNNNCYLIVGRYYGLFQPSLGHSYIKTTNTSSGIDLIWTKDSDTIIAQADSGSVFFNSLSTKGQITDYNLNKLHNDSVYTYFDTKLKVKRYKENVNLKSIPINQMGAL